MDPLLRCIKRWAEDLKDGTLAARIDELENFGLGDESVASFPFHTLMRRAEQRRKLQVMPYERFGWLADGQSHAGEDAPQVLHEGADGMQVLLLNSSHQILRAGQA